jgi:hypothetical protein
MDLYPREDIQALLGVKCVFPSDVPGCFREDLVARCMMEYAVGAKLIPYKESLEDVIVRMRRFQTEDNEGETAQPAKVP